jgi:glyoxylase-like metal-dependent hydrolase (beta-lactamase superfamily II)
LITHRDAAEKLNNYDKRYPQNFLDSLGHRNPVAGRELVNGPVDRAAISFDQSMTVVADNYHIKLYHMPGPTSGNIWAYIPETGVLFTGDSVVVNDYPLLAEICCTDWLCTLEEGLQRFDARYLVPGRGPVSPPEMAVQPMREYLSYIEDSVRQQILDGKNRETLAALEESLLTKFPTGDLPRDWVQKQIKLGLERVYNEIKSGMEVVLI